MWAHSKASPGDQPVDVDHGCSNDQEIHIVFNDASRQESISKDKINNEKRKVNSLTGSTRMTRGSRQERPS